MKDAIISIIDKLNVQVLLLGVWIISIIGVFLPKNFIEYIGLLQMKTRYQWIISLAFLFIGVYYLVLLIRWGHSKLSAKWKNKKVKKYFFKVLRELTDDEKRILINFYRKDEKKFGLEANLDVRSASVNVLSSKMIISSGSQIGDFLNGFSYFIQPGAYEELNNMLAKGDIKIDDDYYEWATYNK